MLPSSHWMNTSLTGLILIYKLQKMAAIFKKYEARGEPFILYLQNRFVYSVSDSAKIDLLFTNISLVVKTVKYSQSL